MTEILVEVLTEAVNAPVLRMPGRRYPGVLLQGDSLKVLYSLTEDLGELIDASCEAADIVSEVKNILHSYLETYERSLREAGIDLPYSGSITSGAS